MIDRSSPFHLSLSRWLAGSPDPRRAHPAPQQGPLLLDSPETSPAAQPDQALPAASTTPGPHQPALLELASLCHLAGTAVRVGDRPACWDAECCAKSSTPAWDLMGAMNVCLLVSDEASQ